MGVCAGAALSEMHALTVKVSEMRLSLSLSQQRSLVVHLFVSCDRLTVRE